MLRKGQIEFIALFGVIFVVVAVVFYAYQSGSLGISPVPAGVAEQQKTVTSSLDGFIRLSAINILSNISTYGGYPNEDAFYSDIEFNSNPVPYWQKDGTTDIPSNIPLTFMNELSDYIKDNIDAVIEQIDMEEVTVQSSGISVTGNVMNDKIVLSVYLPVYVQGYLIPQPFTVNIPTYFGEILEFSQNLVTYSNQNRPFEYFTLGSMLLSEMDDGVKNVPFLLTLTECGDSVQKTWFDVEPYVDYAIKTTLAHTYLPGQAPLGTFESQNFPKYNIPPLGYSGKTYPELEVNFHLPDDFELNRAKFNFNPDPVMAVATPLPMTSICTSDPVYVRYYLRYPMIVTVRDPTTGNLFRFANDVYIYNNGPGDWGTVNDYSDASEELCKYTYCDGKITVKDTNGNPVPRAWVSFMGCDIGLTSVYGMIIDNFNVPCTAGTLAVYKNGYKEATQQVSHTDLAFDKDFTITIRNIPTIRLNLYEVKIDEVVKNSHYLIEENNLGSIEPLGSMNPGRKLKISFTPLSPEKCEGDWKTCFREYDTSSGILNNIAADDYVVHLQLEDSAGKIRGDIITTLLQSELVDDTTLNIYVPSSTAYSLIDHDIITDSGNVDEMTQYMEIFENVFDYCGISPISTMKPEDIELNLPCNYMVS